MLDGSHLPPLQRSRGAAMVRFAHARGATRLADLHQSGSAKVLFPRTPHTTPEVVFLNTSGGLTSGDHLDLTLSLGDQTHLLATTQTAERAYHAAHGPAQVTVTATLGAGSRLDWMPQETILFAHSHLIRRTTIDLAEGAQCLLAETVILGRHAMGETLTQARLTDHRMVRRKGRPVWAETLHVTPDTLSSDGPALLNGARAFAVVCLIAQGAEDAVAPLRAALPTVAVSGWDGKCIARLTAPDGWPLKTQLAQILHILTGRPLPRVWVPQGTP